jgi:gliding motility-associated-like protein
LKKSLLLFLFQLIFTLPAFAADFIVTSNADAGPGTLRQALLDAAGNGVAEKDYIKFNITDQSEAGRTITITTNLPNVSSNIVIDGTTQPGAPFGRSNAKIIFQPDSHTKLLYGLILMDAKGIELYGLYIRDFGAQISEYRYTGAIFIENCEDIQVGASGKGNVFSHNYASLLNDGISLKNGSNISISANNLKVYANFFGFEPDGTSYRVYDNFQNFDNIFLNYWQGDIQIGGDDISDRNFFGYGAFIINTARQPSNTAVISIKNNYFRYDIDGRPKPRTGGLNQGSANAIEIAQDYGQDDSYFYPYTVNIINNKIVFPGDIHVGLVTGDINFKGNAILNEGENTGYSVYVSLKSKARIQVGGEAIGESNSIYYQLLSLYSKQSVVIQHNSIYCINDTFGPWHFASSVLYTPPLPEVSITKITATTISGKATPLSKIELFDDGVCMKCEPYTYIATTIADANGNWNCNCSVTNGAIASSTINGYTSYFTHRALLNPTQARYKITHYSCSDKGSVKGIIGVNMGGYVWKDQLGNVISTNADISDLLPGKYNLSLPNGTCSDNFVFNIYDATPKISETYKKIIQPSCLSKGAITGLSLANDPSILSDAFYQGQNNIYTYKWLDAAGAVKSTSLDLNNVDAGIYKLEVTYNNTCTTTYGPITLTNTTGPNIIQTNATITPTNCGQSTGSITGITATGTGTIKYSWKNAQNQQVANTLNLTNQPAGVYTLQVTDDTNCGPVYTSAIAIPEVNGVTMDETQTIVTAADCQYKTGSITNINVTGATTYQWLNSNGAIVGNTPNLNGVPPGSYHLIASNSMCSKTSQVYVLIQQTNITNYGGISKILKDATCGFNNGSITVLFTSNPPELPKTYRWVKQSTGLTIATTSTPVLSGLDAGTYDIYATNNTGCERLLITYSIGRTPGLNVQSNTAIITDDNCGTGKGSITGIVATGSGTLNFAWTDANNQPVGNAADLFNLKAGVYHLKITDGLGCEQGLVYTINNIATIIPPPNVADLQICSAGDALLSVINPVSAYTYRLYNSGGSSSPLDVQPGGKFKINVKTDRSYYISQLIGECESSRSEVKISVGITSVNIANTFSPNGDGINDTWKISGIESYPNANVQIFTRSGEKIFESVGYPIPFNGTYQGKQLAVSTYYYIINLNSGCNLLSGSLTIVR